MVLALVLMAMTDGVFINLPVIYDGIFLRKNITPESL